jgi:excisionase family DNA binding protein
MATIDHDLITQNKLLTHADVLKILGVSRKTLYIMRKEGKIKSLLIGGQIRFSQQEIKTISELGMAS